MSKRLANIGKQTYVGTISAFFFVVIFSIPLAILLHRSLATGTASFNIAPTDGSYTVGSTITVTVTENSTDSVNAVQANLTYNASQLQVNSVNTGSSASSPFTLCAQSSGGGGVINVGCAIPNNTVTGTQTVATITFSALSATSSTPITIASGSAIVRSSDQTNVWNQVDNQVTYAITTPVSGGSSPVSPTPPASTPPATTTKTTTPPSSTTKSSSSTPTSSSTSSTVTTSPAPSPTTPTTITSTPTTAAVTTTNSTFNVKVISTSGSVVVGAKVTIDGSKTATTNSQGVATFNNVSSGIHSLTIDASGSPISVTKAFVLPNQTTQQLVFHLTASRLPTTLVAYSAASFGALALLAGIIAWVVVHRRIANSYLGPKVEAVVMPHTPTTPSVASNNLPSWDQPQVVSPLSASVDQAQPQTNLPSLDTTGGAAPVSLTPLPESPSSQAMPAEYLSNAPVNLPPVPTTSPVPNSPAIPGYAPPATPSQEQTPNSNLPPVGPPTQLGNQ